MKLKLKNDKRVKVQGKIKRMALDGSWVEIDFGYRVIRFPAEKVKRRLW